MNKLYKAAAVGATALAFYATSCAIKLESEAPKQQFELEDVYQLSDYSEEDLSMLNTAIDSLRKQQYDDCIINLAVVSKVRSIQLNGTKLDMVKQAASIVVDRYCCDSQFQTPLEELAWAVDHVYMTQNYINNLKQVITEHDEKHGTSAEKFFIWTAFNLYVKQGGIEYAKERLISESWDDRAKSNSFTERYSARQTIELALDFFEKVDNVIPKNDSELTDRLWMKRQICKSF